MKRRILIPVIIWFMLVGLFLGCATMQVKELDAYNWSITAFNSALRQYKEFKATATPEQLLEARKIEPGIKAVDIALDGWWLAIQSKGSGDAEQREFLMKWTDLVSDLVLLGIDLNK